LFAFAIDKNKIDENMKSESLALQFINIDNIQADLYNVILFYYKCVSAGMARSKLAFKTCR